MFIASQIKILTPQSTNHLKIAADQGGGGWWTSPKISACWVWKGHFRPSCVCWVVLSGKIISKTFGKQYMVHLAQSQFSLVFVLIQTDSYPIEGKNLFMVQSINVKNLIPKRTPWFLPKMNQKKICTIFFKRKLKYLPWLHQEQQQHHHHQQTAAAAATERLCLRNFQASTNGPSLNSLILGYSRILSDILSRCWGFCVMTPGDLDFIFLIKLEHIVQKKQAPIS